jgi:hypothetical protein
VQGLDLGKEERGVVAPAEHLTVHEDQSAELQAASGLVTYGWGMIPVEARIGSTGWTTSLYPKDGAWSSSCPIERI